jgi:Domain of unknown function (DUF4167)
MRNGQNKRMRGRSRKSQNPLTRVYESNGPDVKIRGTASHVAEKYLQLARDAHGSGDPIAAENYYQHAEHYFRLIAGAQEQFRQTQPFFRGEGDNRGGDDGYDDGEDEGVHPMMGGGEPGYGREQPFMPREQQQQQPYQQRREHQQQPFGAHEPQPHVARPPQQHSAPPQDAGSELPSFITGGGQPQPQGFQNGQNGHEQSDRFPLHRRRRRHRGPRNDMSNAGQGGGAEPADDVGGVPPGE